MKNPHGADVESRSRYESGRDICKSLLESEVRWLLGCSIVNTTVNLGNWLAVSKPRDGDDSLLWDKWMAKASEINSPSFSYYEDFTWQQEDFNFLHLQSLPLWICAFREKLETFSHSLARNWIFHKEVLWMDLCQRLELEFASSWGCDLGHEYKPPLLISHLQNDCDNHSHTSKERMWKYFYNSTRMLGLSSELLKLVYYVNPSDGGKNLLIEP